jgi:hypothetical protein
VDVAGRARRDLVLEEALRLARDESPGRSQQLDDMIAEEGWFYAARFASGMMQGIALNLMPHQLEPFTVDEDGEVDEDNREAQILLRHMLRAGISRYHPRPVQALAEAEAKKKRRPR